MKILIIEDERIIADSLKKGLIQEGYVADTAYDGMLGYDLASAGGYDLIVLDLLLPGLNGIEICKKLRNYKIYTPVLILTAKGQVQDKIEGFKAGADDYLAKPFAFEEFLARIKAIIRRSKKIGNYDPVLSVQDLTLNTETFEAARSNVKINLSYKEFLLLEYLMRNANKVINKEKIIDNVWSYEDDILPNTVEVYIGYLRKKIDKPFKNLPPLIQTARGFGYKLIDK